ncbi:MAG TPA: alkaline phosphatase family protein [Pilimelia sp.]|nr:alkaline phosphatase family protein [Pilimelia sp.]
MAAPADPSPTGPAERARLGLRVLRDWRPTVAQARAMARNAVMSFIVLSVTLWLLPGVDAAGLVSMLWLVVLVAAVGAVLRPLLLAVATVLGGYGALVVGIGVQVVVIYVALRLGPGVRLSHFALAFVAAFLVAVLSTVVQWLADAGTDDRFIAETLRAMLRRRRLAGPRPPGMLVIQLDGVAAPILQWAVRAGNLPHLGDWLRSGRYRMRRWHTGLPATTPAAQAGLLYGDDRAVPAFRWFEKETGRLVACSRPRDAALVEERISSGRGLLAGGGASISNVFTGDAATSLLTVSRGTLPGRSPAYAAFMTSPTGLVRALVLSAGEVLRELHQARLQRRRRVWPRVPRGGRYLLVRPAATVLLRDLTVSLVAEQLAAGAPVVFCDFVDYDEVAHHAGPARGEAMGMLEALDRVVGVLSRLAVHGGARDYRVVVLSDHGQSQGATFRQRYGQTLTEVVHRLVAAGAAPSAAAGDPAAEVVVAASGNLALVYLTRLPGRATWAELDERYPGLVRGLAAHPGVGFVVVDAGADGPVAVGAEGVHRLADGAVTGADPLAPYGPRAAAVLRDHQRRDHVGDLVVVSVVDTDTDEVAAFEELVGNHGGLGGWQTDAVLIHPALWRVDEELVGPASVHRQLRRWCAELGLTPPHPPDPAAPPAAAPGYGGQGRPPPARGGTGQGRPGPASGSGRPERPAPPSAGSA